ncbi:MAG: ferritin family protein [Bacillota bacterium]
MIFESLNELEILKIARGIEETGYKFYMDAAEKFGKDEAKEMFLYLAADEQDHIKTFQNLYDRIANDPSREEHVYEETMTAYLKAISETSIFHTRGITESGLANIATVRDALYIGIQAEKDSILFYEGILKNTKNEFTKKVLDRLIKEEVKHLHNLKVLMDEAE